MNATDVISTGRKRTRQASRIAVTRSADAPELRTGAILEISTAVSEEEFLSQIEIAIDGPAAAALQPLDDLTPLPWEVR